MQFIGEGDPRGPNPNSEAAGDCHYWNVWHGAGDWKHYAECTARFVSEFGFAAPPQKTFCVALRGKATQRNTKYK